MVYKCLKVTAWRCLYRKAETCRWYDILTIFNYMYIIKVVLCYKIICLHTYSMVQSPSWEANWFAANQEIPCISRNPKVHYRTHKRPPPLPLSWASPIQSIYPHPTSWRSILILSTHLRLVLSSGLFPSR